MTRLQYTKVPSPIDGPQSQRFSFRLVLITAVLGSRLRKMSLVSEKASVMCRVTLKMWQRFKRFPSADFKNGSAQVI